MISCIETNFKSQRFLELLLLRGKKNKTQITNIINENGVINTNLMNVKRMIKGNYEQLSVHKFDN